MPSLDPALPASGHRAPVIQFPAEQMAAKPFAILFLGAGCLGSRGITAWMCQSLDMQLLSWVQFDQALQQLASRFAGSAVTGVYGVPVGACALP